MTLNEWKTRAFLLFGEDMNQWAFVCPVCKIVTKAHEWPDAGAGLDAVAYSCVGRWLDKKRDAFSESGPGPCNYAGGGLFGLNPVPVELDDGEVVFVFDFARPTIQHPEQ